MSVRKQYSKSEKKELQEKIKELYDAEIVGKKDDVVYEEREGLDYGILFLNGKPAFFFVEEIPIPTLQLLLSHDFLKKVVVDMGAVKFVTSGADIMRPGITSFAEEIRDGEIIVIVEETHGKPLAVGKMLYSGEEAAALDSGKVVKNLHYIGDDLWNLK